MRQPVALVTGATGGMGQEIVRELSTTHHVIAQGRNPEKLAALATAYGATVWQQELTDYGTLGEYCAALPELDVLVHAAAIASTETVATANLSSWEQQFAINVTAPAQLTKALLPQLRASAGTVIFIGSGASVRASANAAVYVASKHALKGLADCLRIDEQQHNLRVTTLAPGPTDTEMLQGLIAPELYDAASYIKPASIARSVRFIVDAPADAHLSDVFVRPRREIKR